MSPAARFWIATIGGVTIFAIATLVWMKTSAANPIVHWGAYATGFLGWVLYSFGAWFGRCPACGTWLWRYSLFGDIFPECPTCGRDRYAVHAEGDRA
jgi:hypothetical protein